MFCGAFGCNAAGACAAPVFNALLRCVCSFGISAGLTEEQLSTFFSIMKFLLYRARSMLTDRGVWPALTESFDVFKSLVILHSFVADDGSGFAVFTRDIVSKVTAFATETYVFRDCPDNAAIVRHGTTVALAPQLFPPLHAVQDGVYTRAGCDACGATGGGGNATAAACACTCNSSVVTAPTRVVACGVCSLSVVIRSVRCVMCLKSMACCVLQAGARD